MFIQDNIKNSFLDCIMPIITVFGNGAYLWIGIAIAFLFTKRDKKVGLMILVCLALCGIIGNLTIKNIVMRARPFNVYSGVQLLIEKPLDYSFPSGHTMTSIASATILLYKKKKKAIIFMVIAIAIAFSRLYLFVHFPSDVLIGGAIGFVISKITIKLFQLIDIKFNKCEEK